MIAMQPYFYTFQASVKGRWLGKPLLEVFLHEFSYIPPPVLPSASLTRPSRSPTRTGEASLREEKGKAGSAPPRQACGEEEEKQFSPPHRTGAIRDARWALPGYIEELCEGKIRLLGREEECRAAGMAYRHGLQVYCTLHTTSDKNHAKDADSPSTATPLTHHKEMERDTHYETNENGAEIPRFHVNGVKTSERVQKGASMKAEIQEVEVVEAVPLSSSSHPSSSLVTRTPHSGWRSWEDTVSFFRTLPSSAAAAACVSLLWDEEGPTGTGCETPLEGLPSCSAACNSYPLRLRQKDIVLHDVWRQEGRLFAPFAGPLPPSPLSSLPLPATGGAAAMAVPKDTSHTPFAVSDPYLLEILGCTLPSSPLTSDTRSGPSPPSGVPPLLLVYKPCGMPVHPSGRYRKHTVTALLETFLFRRASRRRTRCTSRQTARAVPTFGREGNSETKLSSSSQLDEEEAEEEERRRCEAVEHFFPSSSPYAGFVSILHRQHRFELLRIWIRKEKRETSSESSSPVPPQQEESATILSEGVPLWLWKQWKRHFSGTATEVGEEIATGKEKEIPKEVRPNTVEPEQNAASYSTTKTNKEVVHHEHGGVPHFSQVYVVHRLDAATSGVLLLGLTAAAAKEVAAIITQKENERVQTTKKNPNEEVEHRSLWSPSSTTTPVPDTAPLPLALTSHPLPSNGARSATRKGKPPVGTEEGGAAGEGGMGYVEKVYLARVSGCFQPTVLVQRGRYATQCTLVPRLFETKEDLPFVFPPSSSSCEVPALPHEEGDETTSPGRKPLARQEEDVPRREQHHDGGTPRTTGPTGEYCFTCAIRVDLPIGCASYSQALYWCPAGVTNAMLLDQQAKEDAQQKRDAMQLLTGPHPHKKKKTEENTDTKVELVSLPIPTFSSSASLPTTLQKMEQKEVQGTSMVRGTAATEENVNVHNDKRCAPPTQENEEEGHKQDTSSHAVSRNRTQEPVVGEYGKGKKERDEEERRERLERLARKRQFMAACTRGKEYRPGPSIFGASNVLPSMAGGAPDEGPSLITPGDEGGGGVRTQMIKEEIVTARTAKTASSLFQCVQYDAIRHESVVYCRLLTGRTHQLRVHLAALGHPIVGDRKYQRMADKIDACSEMDKRSRNSFGEKIVEKDDEAHRGGVWERKKEGEPQSTTPPFPMTVLHDCSADIAEKEVSKPVASMEEREPQRPPTALHSEGSCSSTRSEEEDMERKRPPHHGDVQHHRFVTASHIPPETTQGKPNDIVEERSVSTVKEDKGEGGMEENEESTSCLCPEGIHLHAWKYVLHLPRKGPEKTSMSLVCTAPPPVTLLYGEEV